MTEKTIKGKIQYSTTQMYRETFEVMCQFGIITHKQKELIERVIDDFKYGKNKLCYDSLDIFFRYDSDLFDKTFLDKVGNPEQYNLEDNKENE